MTEQIHTHLVALRLELEQDLQLSTTREQHIRATQRLGQLHELEVLLAASPLAAETVQATPQNPYSH